MKKVNELIKVILLIASVAFIATICFSCKDKEKQQENISDNAIYMVDYDHIIDIVSDVEFPDVLLIEYWDGDCMDYDYLTQCGVRCGDEDDPYIKIVINPFDKEEFMNDYTNKCTDNWSFSYFDNGYYWIYK